MLHFGINSDEPTAVVKPKKPETSWHLVIWPILTLWLISWVYIQCSEYKDAASIAMPILMAATAFLVFLLNAVAGSVTQNRLNLQAMDEATTCCGHCGKSDCDLQVVEYSWYAFLIALIVESRVRGKFCKACTEALLNRMFRKTLFFSLFGPPIIIWAWIEKEKILKKLT